MSERYINVEGTALKLSNLEKIFYPAAPPMPPVTKGDVLKFYYRLGPTVLPHLRNRPFTLKRYPSGVTGEMFFEKKCPSHRPKWVQTGEFGGINYCLINDLRSLIWAVNLAAIELHATLACIEDMQRPSWIAFDLDPGEGAGLLECAQVALLVRDLLEPFGLESFPKTSGSKGIHLYLPLNTEISYDQTTAFARAVAELLEHRHPDRVVSRMSKKLRAGKIFIDWSQNVDFKTTVCVYSLRAADRPTVSTPLAWKELERAAGAGAAARQLLTFETTDVLKRIKQSGDLFAPVLTLRQKLPAPSALALPPRKLKFA